MSTVLNGLLSFAAAHHQVAVGFAAGAVLSNPGTAALLVFTGVTKIPGVGAWIGRHPDQAKAWSDAFDRKIDELVDKYAAAQATPPSPAAPKA